MASEVLPGRVAARILEQSLGLRRGRSLLIEGWSHTLPIAEVFWLEARKRGIRPTLILEPERVFFRGQSLATPEEANATGGASLAALSGADAFLFLYGPSDFLRFERIPRSRRAAIDRWARTWNQELYRLRIPSVHFLGADATAENARRYGVSLTRWWDECNAGSLVDPDLLRRTGQPVVSALRRGKLVRVDHPNGTHLEFELDGHAPVLQDGVVDARDLADGRVWTPMPSGLVVIPFDGGSAEGRFVANRPSQHLRGSIVSQQWTLRQGRLTGYHAKGGLGIFRGKYAGAGTERDRPSIFSIGLNPAIRDLPFAEDQEKGVVTLYLGRNDDIGGGVRGSYREYALLRGATVAVDGDTILRSGRWV